jgi:hypothetical protein
MKTAILAAAIVATASTVALPSIAMENVASESQAKIQRILAKQKGENVRPAKSAGRAITFTMKKPVALDRHEAAKIRLFADRAGPSGK